VRPLSIVHTENSAGWGGQEIRILTEARGMLERGHRVTLLTPPETPIYGAAARYGVPTDPLGIRRKQPSDLCVLRSWLSRHRREIDILNTHSSTDSWLGAISCASMADAPPIVRTRHVSTRINNSAATRWLYGRASAHIVTAGEAIRRNIAETIAVPLDRMTSVPTGIDLRQFVPGDAVVARSRVGLPQRPTLGIVATLRDWKGHEYLFEAIALERNAWADWNIVVVGDGPYRAKLDVRVAQLGLGEKVRFVGQQEDVVPWLQALDLFTLPSYGEEGVPQAIMQAMACAIAVVSTPVGAIREAVDEGVTGVLVEPRSASALSAGLVRLRDDPELRARYSLAGRARAMDCFGIDRMLDGMESVFRHVLNPA
jgi:glycosyltransferase involved in cell wall biosynthesis